MQKQTPRQGRFLCKKVLSAIALFTTILTAGIVFPSNIHAQGNLLLNPGRIVFEGQKKTQELNLANSGTDTARYVISMTEIRMNPDGTFENITQPDSGQNFASPHVRFFPRSVVLAPNEAQSVRIQVSKADSLETGEYRSHLYFRAVPAEKPLGEKSVVKDSSNISVHLTPIFGISIPVIIRVGDCSVQASFSNASLQIVDDTLPLLNLELTRSGNISIYGDVTVDYTSPQGQTIRAAVVNGIAVYTPTPRRRFKLKLNNAPGINYHAGKLHIVYTAPANAKAPKLAETEVVLN